MNLSVSWLIISWMLATFSFTLKWVQLITRITLDELLEFYVKLLIKHLNRTDVFLCFMS